MDLITSLPRTKDGFDARSSWWWTGVSKMIHCIPTTTKVTAPELAKLFFDNIFKYHGLPSVIVSDRDPRFTGNFWRALFASVGTRLAMSTSRHPQTDGQTERANRSLEEMLRSYVSRRTDDWSEKLSALEFAYNNHQQASTGALSILPELHTAPSDPGDFGSCGINRRYQQPCSFWRHSIRRFVTARRTCSGREIGKLNMRTNDGDIWSSRLGRRSCFVQTMSDSERAVAAEKLQEIYSGPFIVTEKNISRQL